MTTSRRKGFPHIRIAPDLEIGPGGPVTPVGAPTPTLGDTDNPAIRIDDLLELESLDDRTNAQWGFVHKQFDGWGSDRSLVEVVYIIRRWTDQSLWAAWFTVVAGPKLSAQPDGERLLHLRRVIGSEVVTTVYTRPGRPGQRPSVLACVQPTDVEILED